MAQESWVDEELANHLDRVGSQFIRMLESKIHELRMAYDDALSDATESLFATSATSLTIQPQSENWFRVDLVIACYSGPAGSTGFVELGGGGSNGGDDKFPIGNGLPISLPMRLTLENTDQRIISAVTLAGGVLGARASGGAGFLYLGLYGKEIPKDGARRW